MAGRAVLHGEHAAGDGPAPRQHPGLWFNFGHAHQEFTLGPVAGRLVAGERTWIDAAAYLPGRFG